VAHFISENKIAAYLSVSVRTLQKAKHELGTDADAVALDHICIAYGSNAVVIKTAEGWADMIPVSQREEVAHQLLEKLDPEDQAAVIQDVCPNYAA